MFDINCFIYDNFYENPEEIRDIALNMFYNKNKDYSDDNKMWEIDESHDKNGHGNIFDCDITNYETSDKTYGILPINLPENPMHKIKTLLNKDIVLMNEKNQSFVLSSCMTFPRKTVIPKILNNYDIYDHWEGYLFLNPNPPINSGISILNNNKYACDSIRSILNMKKEIQQCILEDFERESDDVTKWKIDSKIGNAFNRLVLIKRDRFHASTMNFGTKLCDSRLVQYFSFSTLK
jgi:hypothetical protein